jgi:hypothetical protein
MAMSNNSCAPDEICIQPVFEAKTGQLTGLVGEVKSKGIEIHDVNPGDFVVTGQVSPEARRTNFHFYDYLPLPPSAVQPESALIAPGAALLHAVHESGLRFGEGALLVGDGFAADLLRQILPAFGILCLESVEFAENEGADATFICAQKHLTRDLKTALLHLRPGGLVVSLTKWGINSYWPELFKKQLRLICPNAFGATLRNLKNQPAFQLPRGYVVRTAKKNLADFSEWVKTGKVNLTQIDPNEVAFRDF